MKTFLVICTVVMVFLFTGCTRYHIIKGTPGCESCAEVSVWSTREFEQPSLHYGRTADSAEFDFSAASATSPPSALEAVGAGVIQRMLNVYFPVPTPAPSPADISGEQ